MKVHRPIHSKITLTYSLTLANRPLYTPEDGFQWGINTTMGKYEHARQFFSVGMPFYPSCLVPPAVTLRLRPSVSSSPAVYPSPLLFGSLLSSLTLRLRSPNSLFPLLVFVFASQSRSPRLFTLQLRSPDSLFHFCC